MTWLSELKRAVAGLGTNEPLVAVLANVAAGNSPEARAVICRRIGEDGTLWIASDGRSRKNHELRVSPRAALCFWFAGSREQFRIHGEVHIVTAETAPQARLEVWRSLSEETRAMFFWPTPDVPVAGTNESMYPRTVPAGADIPDSFELLVLHPILIDHLDLKPHPHRRRQWMKSDGWAVEELTP